MPTVSLGINTTASDLRWIFLCEYILGFNLIPVFLCGNVHGRVCESFSKSV